MAMLVGPGSWRGFPIPLLLLTIAVLWASNPPFSYISPFLLLSLNIIFVTLVSLFVALLVGRSFLLRGSPGLLLLGCGILFWGTAGFVSTSVAGRDINMAVSIHNVCVFLSGICHLAGVGLSLRPRRPMAALPVWLGGAYATTLGTVAVIAMYALNNRLPLFFVQGEGGTTIRQLVLGAAISAFVLTVALLTLRKRERPTSFVYWYSLALSLSAIGLLAVMLQSNHGSILSWTGRGAQFLGGAYMLVAAITSVRDSREWGITLESALIDARQRYEGLIELASDGIVIHELATQVGRGKFVEVNSSICTLLGYTPQEMLALTLIEITAPEDHPVIPKEAEKLKRDGVLRHEKTLLSKDGRRIFAELRTRIFEQHGRPMVMSVIHDMTARKQAEDAVRSSEARLARAQRVAKMGSWELDLQSGELLWSDQVYRIFGLTPGEFKPSYEAWMAFIDPDQRDRVRTVVENALVGQAYYVEYTIRLPDGSVRHLLGQANVDFDQTGNPIRMVGTTQDITERKETEMQMRELSQKLTYHVDHSPLAVIEWGPDMRLIRWSGEAERIFGWKAEEVLGKRMDEFRWIYIEDQPKVKEVSVILQTGTDPRQFSVNRNYRKDGSVIHCEWYNSSLLDESGKFVSLLSLVLDVTERKLAEQALRESDEKFEKVFRLNAAPMALTRLRDGLIIDVNESWEKAFGLSRDSVVGHNPAEFGHWKDLHERESLFRDLKSETKSLHREIEFIRQGGEPWIALVSAEVITINGEEVVVTSALDITERKRSEERIREAQKLESLGLLAGGVAHDFNNLLVGVIGNASLARDLLPSGHTAIQLMDQVVKTGEQAAHLTRQMLAYAGKGRFVIEPVNLSDLIPEISGLVQPSISKRISVHFELGDNLPVVHADRGQMQQIYMNLVLNAAEAIGSDPGLITVRTGVRQEHVYLEVRDNGCGMDAATKAKIFDPFYTTKFLGRGLGLAAVAGIVRGHKGVLEVSSAPGHGSCFTVLLPAVKHVSAVSVPTDRIGQLPGGSGTILVVDDEEIVREVAQKALEQCGFTVLAASSGQAAIDMVKRDGGQISLALLDLSMPGMGGDEVLPEFRKLRPEMKVIVSSGYSEDEALRLFQGQEVSGFIQKPYTSSRLVEKIKRTIEIG